MNSDQQEENKAQNEKNSLDEAKVPEQPSSSEQLPEQAQNQSNGVEIARSQQQQQLQQTITLKKMPVCFLFGIKKSVKMKKKSKEKSYKFG